MRSSFTFLRVRGIPIGANWTWLFVFALIAWSLGAHIFPRTYPGIDDTTYIVMGVVTAVLFFASILLHELGHAFRALKEGMEIDGITLWIFGGVARFKGMFPSAGAEGRIAIAGPVVSVALAAGFGAVTAAGNDIGWPAEVVGITDYLARINAILVGFNLVPALPLDGGRVLRAYLWHRQGSFTAATMSAAKAGRAFGGVLIGIGVLGFITGAGIGGIWLVFLGWFLLQAAGAEASFAQLKQALGGIDVADLMTRDPAVVRPGDTLAAFVDDASYGRRHSTYPVVSPAGELVGLMALRFAGDVPPEQRGAATVSDVMLGLDDVPVARPGTPVLDLLEQLQEGPGRAVVVGDGRVVGILSRSDILRALELEQLRGPRPEEAPTRRVPWGVWVIVGAMMLAAAGYIYHPPVAVIEPGESLDVTEDISISGVEVDEVSGEYLLTSVRVTQPNGLGLALSVLQGSEVIPLSQLIPEGQDPEQFVEQQEEAFRDSQRIAAAAAARAVGMEVSVTGNGARVLAIAAGSPAAGVLQEGDVILAVNGERIETASDLRETIGSRPEGTRFTLDVRRDDERREITVRSRDLPDADGAVIGVIPQTADLEVDLPFDISFTQREIGGPSAGSAYALAIIDLLDPGDDARGRSVAATGTISLDGGIGPVGGVAEKARAAESAGAELFLVPASEVDAAREGDLPIRGVRNLDEAIRALRTAA